MATTNAEPNNESLITARNEEFLEAFNDADVDRIMSFFAPDALYSDYAIAALDMSFTATRAYLEKMFSEADKITLSQVSITGDKHFTAAEWILTMGAKTSGNGDDTPETIENVGDQRADHEMEMRGVSLTWYDDDGKQIVRNCDYGVQWSKA